MADLDGVPEKYGPDNENGRISLVITGHDLEQTKFGFIWGPMKVERLYEGPKGHVVIKVNDLEVYVTPKGKKTRVWRGNKELT